MQVVRLGDRNSGVAELRRILATIGLLGLISDRVILLIERWVLAWRRLQSFQS